MRAEQFLKCLNEYDWTRVERLISERTINGGWEVWMQVELALLMKRLAKYDIVTERERTYPDSTERCDFYIAYGPGRKDETYIELKCQNPFRRNPLQDIAMRFRADIIKAENLHLLIGCLAICYGTCEDICQAIQEEMPEQEFKHVYSYVPGVGLTGTETIRGTGTPYITLIYTEIYNEEAD